MSGPEVFWLNVTNGVLGILVLIPLLAFFVTLLLEIGKIARRKIVFLVRLRRDLHQGSAHAGHW